MSAWPSTPVNLLKDPRPFKAVAEFAISASNRAYLEFDFLARRQGTLVDQIHIERSTLITGGAR